LIYTLKQIYPAWAGLSSGVLLHLSQDCWNFPIRQGQQRVRLNAGDGNVGSAGEVKLVSVLVSVADALPPKPLLHSQFGVEARVGIGQSVRCRKVNRVSSEFLDSTASGWQPGEWCQFFHGHPG